jgi:tRNA A37 threonylcarbamoyladenosine biosynthesis protein TsaE
LRLVEWPDRAPDLAEEADLALLLQYDGDSRSVEIEARSARGAALIQKIN